MPRIKCFTAQEAVDMILNELDSDSTEVYMVNIPPDDDLSDEDEIDDSQLGEATVCSGTLTFLGQWNSTLVMTTTKCH